MLAEAVSPQCAGSDRVFGHENAWGLGFGLDDDSYGMGGLGGNYGGHLHRRRVHDRLRHRQRRGLRPG
jgi:hypothetical protein